MNQSELRFEGGREIAASRHPTMTTGPQSIAYFDLLPDELVLKVVSSAVKSTVGDEQHDFLLDVIAHISVRFRRIATEKSLWEGEVSITLDNKSETTGKWSSTSKPRTKYWMESKMKDAISNFIHAGVHSLSISAYPISEPCISGLDDCMKANMPLISGDDILTITERCPALRVLKLCWLRMEPWPIFSIPSSAIEELNLSYMKIHLNMFSINDSALHHTLPNLRVFKMLSCYGTSDDSRIKLPDMTKCKKLEIVDVWGSSVEQPMLKIKRNLPSLRPAVKYEVPRTKCKIMLSKHYSIFVKY